jgi:hypothetical protein
MPECEPLGLSVPPKRAFGFLFTRRRGFSQERLIADKVVEIIELMIGIFEA